MVLAALWMLYSLSLALYGAWKQRIDAVLGGLSIAGLAIVVGASVGFAYQPIEWFTLVVNIRTLTLALLLMGLFLHLRVLSRVSKMHACMNGLITTTEVVIVLLGFELVSVETRDFFEHAIVTHNAALGTPDDLRNLEQLSLSVAWLLYSAVLLGLGIWRRVRWLRFGALSLFAVAILKVFFYDLSFLGGAYRSILFMGLGRICWPSLSSISDSRPHSSAPTRITRRSRRPATRHRRRRRKPE